MSADEEFDAAQGWANFVRQQIADPVVRSDALSEVLKDDAARQDFTEQVTEYVRNADTAKRSSIKTLLQTAYLLVGLGGVTSTAVGMAHALGGVHGNGQQSDPVTETAAIVAGFLAVAGAGAGLQRQSRMDPSKALQAAGADKLVDDFFSSPQGNKFLSDMASKGIHMGVSTGPQRG